VILRYDERLLSLGLVVFLGAMFAASVEAQDITAENTSRYLGNGRWSWTIYLKGTDNTLRDVTCAEYTLHPTFPNPVRKVCNRGNSDQAFALTSSGWGVFEISIKIFLKNGRTRQLRHMLTFETPSVASSLALKTGNIATQVRPGWWRWTVYIEGSENDLRQVRCVEYTLHPTFPDPVKEVCQRGSGSHAFALSENGWGTFPIHIRVLLRDGEVQKMTHELTF